MTTIEKQHRDLLTQSKRVVVKVGTNLLVDKNGKINQKSISALAKELARLRKKNLDVILVSSGAIGAGLQELGFKKKPTALSDLQTAAAIGQLTLLNYYNKYFKKHKCKISQILLTHSDLKDRKRHLNARNTILNLLQHKIIPIINENDAIANEEIKIGDNDVLSSLVSTLIDADLLILLTTPDGLRKPINDKETERVSYLANIDNKVFEFITGKQNSLSTGGMGSKLQAAQTAAKSGALVVIASGFKKNIIQDIFLGKDVGTLIGNKDATTKLNKRKQWISCFHKSQGIIILNACATAALEKKGASLLPIGIEKVEGTFDVGAFVDIMDAHGKIVGHGLSEYSSDEIKKIKGKHSTDIISILGYKNNNAVIHRDNMVMALC